MKKKKATRGGNREGAGRHLKYGEETVNVTFRIPASKVARLKKIVNAELKKYIK